MKMIHSIISDMLEPYGGVGFVIKYVSEKSLLVVWMYQKISIPSKVITLFEDFINDEFSNIKISIRYIGEESK